MPPVASSASHPGRDRTLEQVDALVVSTLDALATDWAALSGPGCDVLDADDLPALARRAALGGKRLRPEMVHWGWIAAREAVPGTNQPYDRDGHDDPREHDEVVRLGAALELLHVFALVHDDVMDGSEFRRGVPSVHARAREAHSALPGLGSAGSFGDHIAILVGFLAWAAAGRSLPFPVTNQFNGTLQFATPLVLGALCGVFCERAGVVNVALEGQMLSGAFAAALVGSMTHSIAAAFVGAIVSSVLMGALLALFSIKYLVDQVVLGVVLNLLASGLTGFLFDQLVQPNADSYNNAPVMQPLTIPLLSKIPFFGPVLFQQTILAYIAFCCVPLAWFLLWRTKWGLRVRAVGEHPLAADTVGISVQAVRWQSVLVGSVFAGLGGAFFTLGSAGQFNKDLTVGNGFIALAALIMGRWRPGLAAVMALFFGFVTQMASQLQTIGTPMPSQFLLILPYIATIIAVAGLVGRVRGPAADGVPYVSDHH